MQLILTYKSFLTKKHIIVKLYNDPVVIKWFKHFKPIYDSYGIRHLEASYDKSIRRRSVFENFTYKNSWKTIERSIRQLESLGYIMPFDLPDEFDYKQQTLNKINRFYTYNMLWYLHKDKTPNPFDDKFIFPKDMSYKTWYNILQPINNSICILENFTSNLLNSKFVDDNYPIYAIGALPNLDMPVWLEFTEDEQKLNYSFMERTEENLVLLNSSMLGKSIMQSFYDHDDLLAKDCTGRLGSHGGFLIDTNVNRKKIYQSAEFNHWVEGHKLVIDALPLEFPIGFVAHTSMPLQNYVFNNLEKIEFIE